MTVARRWSGDQGVFRGLRQRGKGGWHRRATGPEGSRPAGQV